MIWCDPVNVFEWLGWFLYLSFRGQDQQQPWQVMATIDQADIRGQLGPSEIHDVQAAFRAHTVPGSLNGVATSDSILLRYSMMGSLVLYIDRTYGKARLKGLLQFDSQQEILSSLGVTEGQFLDGWRHFMLHSTGLSR